jgi:hypothetical protein
MGTAGGKLELGEDLAPPEFVSCHWCAWTGAFVTIVRGKSRGPV